MPAPSDTRSHHPPTGTPSSSSADVQAALESLPDGAFAMTGDRRFVLFNAALRAMTGYTAAEVVGLRCACADADECAAETGRSLRGTLCPGLPCFREPAAQPRRVRAVRARGGDPVAAEVGHVFLRDAAGAAGLVIGTVRPRGMGAAGNAEGRDLPGTPASARRLAELRSRLTARHGFDNLLGTGPLMEAVFHKVRAAAAAVRSTVLITGPSGTGKEIIARTIHALGPQRAGPFVPLNCAALPRDLIESELFGHLRGSFTGAGRDFPGLFRAAENGTIFLDEVADMPVETQAKLLRALQDRRVRPVGSTAEVPVNARVIAATNVDPEAVVRAGRMREDLYYRLGVIVIAAPELRRRREDIPLLAEHVLDSLNADLPAGAPRRIITAAALDVLCRHDWPGNVRELENAIASAWSECPGHEIGAEDLPARVRESAERAESEEQGSLAGGPVEPLDEVMARAERSALLAAIRRCGGNRLRAAESLGIPRSRFYRRLEALGIGTGEADDPRRK